MATVQKDIIIEKAMQMFVSEGLKAVRMDDIASRLGISKRTIYEIFGDKEELIFQAMMCHFSALKRDKEAIMRSSDNVLIGMIAIIDAVVTSAEHDWRLRNALSRFYPAVNRRLELEVTEVNFTEFKHTLEIGVKEGLLVDSLNLDLAIAMLYYVAMGIVDESKRIVLPKGVSHADAFREVVVNFMRGISTTKGIKIIDEFVKTKTK